MDPRVKIVLLFFFLLLIFFVENAAGFTALSVSVVLLMVFSKVPLGMQLRSIRPILWIVLFTFGVHLFMTPGTELFRIGPFAATWEGVVRGGYIGLRLVLLILLSTLLTLTTSPLRLTDGLEALLSPLRRVNVPVHELSMMMTIALRFIPTLLEELDRIMKAQKARGADFERGNIVQRLKAVVPVLVPLFLSASQHTAPHTAEDERGGKPQSSRMTPQIKQGFTEIIREGQEAGEIRSDVPVGLIAEMFHSLYQAAAFSHLDLTFQENIALKTRLLLDGIRKRNEELQPA